MNGGARGRLQRRDRTLGTEGSGARQPDRPNQNRGQDTEPGGSSLTFHALENTTLSVGGAHGCQENELVVKESSRFSGCER